MNKRALFLILGLAACNPNKTHVDAEFHPTQRGWGNARPVWADEFNSMSLDGSKWVVAQYCGGYNGELQCYRPQNISFDGSHMIITARQEACGGDTLPADAQAIWNDVGTVTCGQQATFNYTSARIHTRIVPPMSTGWRYGRIEIRARLPYGQGTWPAFWMLPLSEAYGPWPRSGEIDIMEAVNFGSANSAQDPGDYVQSNIHLCSTAGYIQDTNVSPATAANCAALGSGYYKASYPHGITVSSVPGWSPDLVRDFHIYAMEWSDLDMRFFVDDQLIGQVGHTADAQNIAPFRQPFYLIINLAVGGNMPVSVDPSNWLPNPSRAELVIDWVRVYSCVPDPTARNCIYQGQGLGRLP